MLQFEVPAGGTIADAPRGETYEGRAGPDPEPEPEPEYPGETENVEQLPAPEPAPGAEPAPDLGQWEIDRIPSGGSINDDPPQQGETYSETAESVS